MKIRRWSRRSVNAWLAVALAGATVVVGAAPAGAIIGGVKADSAEYPYAARIQFTRKVLGLSAQTVTCSGTLISPTTVLTAMHCLGAPFGGQRRIFQAGEGTVTLGYGTSDSRKYKVAQLIPYDPAHVTDFKPQNDLALLKLQSTASATPAGLGGADGLANRMWVTELGYGRTSTTSSALSSSLKAAGLQLTGEDAEHWQAEDPGFDPAGGPVTGKCYQGDSGGPLVAAEHGTNLVIGVFSLYTDPNTAVSTCTFMRVDTSSPFSSWIQQHM
jgi:secreted trypsin-like serine protease